MEMKFPDHTAVITLVGDETADQWDLLRESDISVPGIVEAGRVESGHDATSARGADWALAIGVSKRDTAFDQFVYIGRENIGISKRCNGVKTLLIGAVPKDIRAF